VPGEGIKTMKKVFLVGAIVSAAALSMATDPQYNFEWIRGISANPIINDTAGKLLNANGSFNTITNTFSWYGHERRAAAGLLAGREPGSEP
jgi:hypothetical protein